MLEPFLAINFTPEVIELFSVENRKGSLRVLDSLKKNYKGQFSKDIEWELFDLVLTMEKRLGVYFKSAIIGIKKGPVKKIISKNKFLRKYPQKPIRENEFKKMIEECQRESFLKLKKETNDPFHFILISAKIKEVTIDSKKVFNPIGLIGKIISLSITNIYLPIDFYQALKKVFSELNIQASFEID